MTAQHTPGRLGRHGMQIVALDMPAIVYDAKAQYSRPYIVCQPSLYTDPSVETTKANIRRFIAAWNATRNMTVEQLEAMAALNKATKETP